MERDPKRRTGKATRRPGDGRRSTSRVRRNRLLALAILAILALAALAPTGQASDSPARAERQAERALASATNKAEREARRLQREAARSAQKEVKAQHHSEQLQKDELRAAIRLANKENEHAVVRITCTSITVQFNNFDATPADKQLVFQKVLFKQLPAPLLTYIEDPGSFAMEGSSATETIPIVAPLGASTVGIRAHFETGGVKQSFSINQVLSCGPVSQFSLQTTQSLSGPFGAGTLSGAVGQTVDYETVATNTGNTPLTFVGFSDPGCDGGAMGGSVKAIAPRGTATWFCGHTLTSADQVAGAFANAASATARPEHDPSTSSISRTSSGVVISPILPGEEISTGSTPTQNSTGSTSTSSSSSNAGSSTTSQSGSSSSKTGVLSFSSFAVPSLLGPARCVRGHFTISVKSAGVASVIFYLDGHRLGRRTAHSAAKGAISLTVDGSSLKAGLHHLLAKITMVPGSKVLLASRARLVRRCQAVAATHSH